MKMANQMNWKVQGGYTTQGMYIAGADGTAYGWKNTPGISDTLRFMDDGLKKFKGNPPQKVDIPPDVIESGRTNPAKPTTSVIEVLSRVRPVPDGADARNFNIGREFLWIADSEVRDMLTPDKDGQYKFSDAVTARILRFALVDVIRGEPMYFAADEVRKCDFRLKKIESTGNPAFSFTGEFAENTFWGARGMNGRITGEFEIDEKAARIKRFRAYAKCEAWGSSNMANRGVPSGHFPLVFALCETEDELARQIAPAALSRGQPYRDPFTKALEK